MLRTQKGMRGVRRNTPAECLHDMWQQIQITSSCWHWLATTDSAGYGRMTFVGHWVYAHHVIYELYHGPVPMGLEIDHRCHNKGCINPEHLEAVTHQVNCQRAVWRRTRCPKGHPLDGIRRNGEVLLRYCLTCNRLRAAKHRRAA